jgi:hypothetical protein
MNGVDEVDYHNVHYVTYPILQLYPIRGESQYPIIRDNNSKMNEAQELGKGCFYLSYGVCKILEKKKDIYTIKTIMIME